MSKLVILIIFCIANLKPQTKEECNRQKTSSLILKEHESQNIGACAKA